MRLCTARDARVSRRPMAMESGSGDGGGSLFASVVGVGLGVGLGLGLVSAGLAPSIPGVGGASGGGPTAAVVVEELRRLVVDGCETSVTFADFPYYLSEEMRLALLSAAFPYLGQTLLPKHIEVIIDSSRTILLCGPSEKCLLSLAKALANHYNARLLAVDLFDFTCQIKHKYGDPSDAQFKVPRRSITESTLARVYDYVVSLNMFGNKAGPAESLDHKKDIVDDTDSEKNDDTDSEEEYGLLPGRKEQYDARVTYGSSSDAEMVFPALCLDPKIIMQSLYKIIISISECSPVILYIKDVNFILRSSPRAYYLIQKMLKRLSGRVLIIGSHFLNFNEDNDDVDEYVTKLFPYILETKPPKEEAHFEKWAIQMENDMAKVKDEAFRTNIARVLSTYNLECRDLSSIRRSDYLTIGTYIDDIIAPSVSYHLMNNKDPEYKNGRLILSSTSLSHGFRIFRESDRGKDAVETKVDSKDTKDNEYEKRIKESITPASETGVTFEDIGALTDIKESIQELVMLPLQRPHLFNGGLLKPCRGILMFGPPGTGKTMLAKAIAYEAGASFMNISMSTIVSKWYGEPEKSIRALFSLAAKIAPTIIFVDEVDSMLGTRGSSNENEASRTIKNEFMTHWDGLFSKPNERILVLAATNRPFDLDDAIIRRFEHRIMVGLPNVESRELIMKKLLSEEKVEDIDFKELAKMTEGYSGSDLKNLCMTAAYRPVRELLQKEKEMKKNMKKKEEQGKNVQAENPEDKGSRKEKQEHSKAMVGKTKEAVALRPLTMEDLKKAKAEVSPSLSSEGHVMSEINRWNELYGKGGSRKKEMPTYFL